MPTPGDGSARGTPAARAQLDADYVPRFRRAVPPNTPARQRHRGEHRRPRLPQVLRPRRPQRPAKELDRRPFARRPAHIRHRHTDLRRAAQQGLEREEARQAVRGEIGRRLERWSGVRSEAVFIG